MLSRIYQGVVNHSRAAPSHEFSYPVWYLLLHLDEVEAVCALSPLISNEGKNLLSFNRQDYLPGSGSLDQAVKAKIREQTGAEFDGDVFLLTTLRQGGVSMNPLSLFYCFDKEDLEVPVHVLAEVHNTPWNERFTYVINAEPAWRQKRVIRATTKKAFHVSPFMPMDTEYSWQITPLEGEHNVHLSVSRHSETIFAASLQLQSEQLTRHSLHGQLIKFGWQSLSVVRRIYWQAFRLWLKRATFYPYPRPSTGEKISES